MLRDEAAQDWVESSSTEKKRGEKINRPELELQIPLNLMPDAVVIVDRNGNILAVNERVEEKTGFERQELIGRHFLTIGIITERSKNILKDNLAKRAMGIPLAPYEVEVLRKDGKKGIAEVNAASIEYEGKPAVLVIFRDVTERRKMEEAVRESEEKYRSLVELAPDSIMTFDTKGVITSCNTASTRLSGYSRDELVGRHFSKIGVLRARDIPKYLRMLSSTMRGKVPKPFEVIWKHKDGSLRIGDVRFRLMREDGKAIRIQAIMRDITERKQMEDELTRERDLLQALMDNIPDSIFFKDTACRLVMVNRAAGKCTPGINDPKELIGKTDFDTHPRELAEQYYADDQAIIRSGQPVIEKEEPSFNGRWVSTTKVPIKDKAGRVIGIVGITRDITNRKQAEEALRRSAERLEALHKHTIELDKANTVEDIAKSTFNAIEKSLGFNQGSFGVVEGGLLRFIYLHGAKTKQILEMPLDGRGVTVRAVRTGKTQLVPDTREDEDYVWLVEGEPRSLSELTGLVKIGEEVVAVINLESTQLNSFNEEDQKLLEILAMHVASAISRLKRVERLEELVAEKTRDLREAERMAAIGETAAMVGHDLRNPLQVIVNTIYSAKKTLDSLPPAGRKFAENQGIEQLLRMVEEQVDYMNKIVSDLQDYARPLKLDLAETSLLELISETLSTIAVPASVKVSVMIEKNSPKLMIDRVLMRRVFTNLVTNALQAMPNGGQLAIRAVASKNEETVSISVEDTGVGMTGEDLGKLFQPLFTTKPKGTGFGLAVCKRLVEAHDGTIMVESQVAKGSTFTVRIPIRRR